MNKQQIERVLKDYKLAPLKSKGQNFLVDADVARKIVSFLDPYYDNVIEIGPGLGSLTAPLLLKTTSLSVIEIDKGCTKYLQNTHENLNVIHSDFLKYVVPRETISVIGNLPYYITTKLIEKVLLETPNLRVFVFMTESGVKDRLLAKVGTKDYGPLTILFKIIGTLDAKMTVTADKFYPVPHVDSVVFKFVRNDTRIDIPAFYAFLKSIFLTRRKTLMNNLKRNYEESVVKDAYHNLNIALNVRAESVSEQTLLALFHILHRN